MEIALLLQADTNRNRQNRVQEQTTWDVQTKVYNDGSHGTTSSRPDKSYWNEKVHTRWYTIRGIREEVQAELEKPQNPGEDSLLTVGIHGVNGLQVTPADEQQNMDAGDCVETNGDEQQWIEGIDRNFERVRLKFSMVWCQNADLSCHDELPTGNLER